MYDGNNYRYLSIQTVIMKSGINQNSILPEENGNQNESQTNSALISSLWLSVATSVTSTLSYDNASEYFVKLVENYLYVKYTEEHSDQAMKHSEGTGPLLERDGSPAFREVVPVVSSSSPLPTGSEGQTSTPSGDAPGPGQSTRPTPERFQGGYKLKGVEVRYLCRIFVDSLMQSCWNGPDPASLSIR